MIVTLQQPFIMSECKCHRAAGGSELADSWNLPADCFLILICRELKTPKWRSHFLLFSRRVGCQGDDGGFYQEREKCYDEKRWNLWSRLSRVLLQTFCTKPVFLSLLKSALLFTLSSDSCESWKSFIFIPQKHFNFSVWTFTLRFYFFHFYFRLYCFSTNFLLWAWM